MDASFRTASKSLDDGSTVELVYLTLLDEGRGVEVREAEPIDFETYAAEWAAFSTGAARNRSNQ